MSAPYDGEGTNGATGLTGSSDTGIGVLASSADGSAVLADSVNGTAVVGISGKADGVVGLTEGPATRASRAPARGLRGVRSRRG